MGIDRKALRDWLLRLFAQHQIHPNDAAWLAEVHFHPHLSEPHPDHEIYQRIAREASEEFLPRPERYYFRNRPPMYAAMPPNAIQFEPWQPTRPMPGQPNRFVHGWADYAGRLPDRAVAAFELVPAGTLLFHTTRFCDECRPSTEHGLDWWLFQPFDDLKEMARYSTLGESALYLKEWAITTS